MTMHRIEMMEATLAELSNDEAAAVLRQMSRTVSMVHNNPLGIHELTTAEEFAVAVSVFERPARIYNELTAQAWDHHHVLAYTMVEGLEDLPGDPRKIVFDHMNAADKARREESHLFRTDHAAWLEMQAAK